MCIRDSSFSVWFKITELGVQRTIWATSANGYLLLQADGQLKWQQSYGGSIKTLNSNRRFRDTSAWYNVIIAVDSTQSTEANRVRLYVNGVEETSLTSTTYPSQNAEAENVYQDHHYLGAYTGNQIYWAGYMSNVAFISDAQITPSDVGEFDSDSGIWKPKSYSGGSAPSYFLEFKDSSDLGTATGLDADTLTNITAADQATDTPTNNFCTWNPLWQFYRNSTITEGGTEAAGAAGGWSHAGASMGVANGRWYWEWKITNSDIGFISFSTLEGNLNLNQLGHDNSVVMGYGAGHLYTWINGVQGSNESTGWGTWAVNDIIGIYLDLENSDRRFTLYKNGSAISGSTSFPVSFPNAMQAVNGAGEIFPYNVQYENDGGEWNFGGYTTMSNTKSHNDANGYGSFVYSPVLSGVNYYALCTKNLAEEG